MINKNNISISLKKRFCKDFGLPIKMYENENIFQSRLDLFENLFGSRTKWNMFVENLVQNYNNEQDYLEQDNKLLDELIFEIVRVTRNLTKKILIVLVWVRILIILIEIFIKII